MILIRGLAQGTMRIIPVMCVYIPLCMPVIFGRWQTIRVMNYNSYKMLLQHQAVTNFTASVFSFTVHYSYTSEKTNFEWCIVESAKNQANKRCSKVRQGCTNNNPKEETSGHGLGMLLLLYPCLTLHRSTYCALFAWFLAHSSLHPSTNVLRKLHFWPLG